MRTIWQGLFGSDDASAVVVRLCRRAPRVDGGTLWVMPGCKAPPGIDDDLWWYRPLSLDELAAVLRFVGRELSAPPSQVVLMHPRQLSPSPRALGAALAQGLRDRPTFATRLVMGDEGDRWPAALRRELHRCGVAVVDEQGQADDKN